MNILFYKNILMLEYGNVYFNWLEDIREYKYFLQSLLLNVCNRNLFSCQHFETSSDLLFKSSLWFGYMSRLTSCGDINNITLLCLCMVEQFELFPTLMLVFPFLFSLFSKHNWRELCCSNSFRFEMIVIICDCPLMPPAIGCCPFLWKLLKSLFKCKTLLVPFFFKKNVLFAQYQTALIF